MRNHSALSMIFKIFSPPARPKKRSPSVEADISFVGEWSDNEADDEEMMVAEDEEEKTDGTMQIVSLVSTLMIISLESCLYPGSCSFTLVSTN